MLRMEAEADAQRYAEQADRFRATQKLSYLKSGVTLDGSPLDILDETARVSAENLSAMRARAQAEQNQMNAQAEGFRSQGRAALLGGAANAASTLAIAGYKSGVNARTAADNGSTPMGGGGGNTGLGFGSRRRSGQYTVEP